MYKESATRIQNQKSTPLLVRINALLALQRLVIVGFRASTPPTRSAIALVKGSDRPLILASRLHPRLQLQVQSGFWLVVPEKSDAGFGVVNPAYGDRPTLTCAIAPSGVICITTYNVAHHPPLKISASQPIISRRSACMGVVSWHLLPVSAVA